MTVEKYKTMETVLTVELMEGKTTKDLWTDFFDGTLPKKFNQRIVETKVTLGEIDVPYDVYKMLSGYGASKELLETFEIKSVSKWKYIGDGDISTAIYKVIPFHSPDNLGSRISYMSYGASDLGFKGSSIRITINTYTWSSLYTEQRIKDVNKDNARRLRKYLVGLQSVRCVLWGCTYNEQDNNKKECTR